MVLADFFSLKNFLNRKAGMELTCSNFWNAYTKLQLQKPGGPQGLQKSPNAFDVVGHIWVRIPQKHKELKNG